MSSTSLRRVCLTRLVGSLRLLVRLIKQLVQTLPPGRIALGRQLLAEVLDVLASDSPKGL